MGSRRDPYLGRRVCDREVLAVVIQFLTMLYRWWTRRYPTLSGYAEGGTIQPGSSLAHNTTGQSERVRVFLDGYEIHPEMN